MELSYLDEFVTLAGVLNFTEAAKRVHVSQSTLSKHMLALETELGVTLLNRTPSKVELTEEGYYAMGMALHIINYIKDGKQVLESMKSRKPICIDGRFEDAEISGIVFSAIKSCSDKGLRPVTFAHTREEDTMQRLLDGEIDALIDLAPLDVMDDDRIEFMNLHNRHMVLVVEKSSRFARRENVSFSELAEETFAELTWDHFRPGWNHIVAQCEKAGYTPKRSVRSAQTHTEALAAPLNGSLLILAENEFDSRFIDSCGLAAIPIKDEGAVFSIDVMYLKENESKVRGFIRELAAAQGLLKDKHPTF
ncbi:MAG: LysR family transcriptional regulator [Coriobacteriales bacterium]|nr:LysR family transcriptional regulator [Coriobacteriales bacterium]